MKLLPCLFAVVILSLAACLKPDGARQLTGGKGGKATLRVSPYNGSSGLWLQKGTIYIKYATWDAPPDGIYDDSIECVKTDTMITAVFIGLKAGDYFVYASGYDSNIHPPVYVQGGSKCIFESEGVYTLSVAASR